MYVACVPFTRSYGVIVVVLCCIERVMLYLRVSQPSVYDCVENRRNGVEGFASIFTLGSLKLNHVSLEGIGCSSEWLLLRDAKILPDMSRFFL
jgi:hypothetical protein